MKEVLSLLPGVLLKIKGKFITSFGPPILQSLLTNPLHCEGVPPLFGVGGLCWPLHQSGSEMFQASASNLLFTGATKYNFYPFPLLNSYPPICQLCQTGRLEYCFAIIQAREVLIPSSSKRKVQRVLLKSIHSPKTEQRYEPHSGLKISKQISVCPQILLGACKILHHFSQVGNFFTSVDIHVTYLHIFIIPRHCFLCFAGCRPAIQAFFHTKNLHKVACSATVPAKILGHLYHGIATVYDLLLKDFSAMVLCINDQRMI